MMACTISTRSRILLALKLTKLFVIKFFSGFIIIIIIIEDFIFVFMNYLHIIIIIIIIIIMDPLLNLVSKTQQQQQQQQQNSEDNSRTRAAVSLGFKNELSHPFSLSYLYLQMSTTV